MRGLAYFDLARMYCQPYSAGTTNLGVPVVLVTENGYPARNTVGETYDRVIEDLEDAVSLLPATNPRVMMLPSQPKLPHRHYWQRLICTWKNWQAAATYATTVIGTTGIFLFDADEHHLGQ
ncbi:MAG: RagB/SusD family nutrient uptake outer membrane protein [Bacteroidales bacterium]